MAPWLIEGEDKSPTIAVYDEKIATHLMVEHRGKRDRYAGVRVISNEEAKKYETQIEQIKKQRQEEQDRLRDAYTR